MIWMFFSIFLWFLIDRDWRKNVQTEMIDTLLCKYANEHTTAIQYCLVDIQSLGGAKWCGTKDVTLGSYKKNETE